VNFTAFAGFEVFIAVSGLLTFDDEVDTVAA
jgi:hypothetical protein